ncbi:hypothetical protein [Dyella sp.]|uniref:hypothetical protein n=1 Tax=Dyella sp. TaxID=1869338 RepID=UPI002D79D26F|nr:hypothetical protein [Dyella sp.]HET7331802.1 hypothetical protein [Dyella sp.]
MKRTTSNPGSPIPMLLCCRFVHGVLPGGTAVMFGGLVKPARAESAPWGGGGKVLSATDFKLKIVETPSQFNCRDQARTTLKRRV